MKNEKRNKSLDDIGFIGVQPKRQVNPEEGKNTAVKTRKAMDDLRSRLSGKKKAA